MEKLKLNVEVLPEFSSVAYDSALESFLVVISVLTTSHTTDPGKRHPMDIVAVLDRSLSMDGEKMAMLHKTVNLLIDQMRDSDRLSLVSYDDDAEVHLGLINMNKTGREMAREVLLEIKARGSTNLGAALKTGLDVLGAEVHSTTRVRSMLLMTDGLANKGITNRVNLVNTTKRRLETLEGSPSLYCFGYGSDHDAQLLSELALAGHGNYYFMQTNESVVQAFADCVGGLMSVVAQSIDINLKTTDATTELKDVQTQFNKSVTLPNECISVLLDDIFSDERRDILAEIRLHALPKPTTEHKLLHVTVTYTTVLGEECQIDTFATIERSDSAKIGDVSLFVDEQRNRVMTARAMDQAKTLGGEGELEKARDVLRKCREQIQASPSHAMPTSLALIADLYSIERDMATEEQYKAVGLKKLHAKSRKHWVQRSAECTDSEHDTYTTNMKLSMKKAWRGESSLSAVEAGC